MDEKYILYFHDQKACLLRLRFHILQYIYVILLIEQGENIKYLQNKLRLSSPKLTLDVHAYLVKPLIPRATCWSENAVFLEKGQQNGSRKKSLTCGNRMKDLKYPGGP